MLVNEETLAKIAALFGVYKPYYTEAKNNYLTADNYMIDHNELADFLSENEAGMKIEELGVYELFDEFVEKNRTKITRARRLPVKTIISESSILGTTYLSDQLIERIEILLLLIGKEDFNDFKSYIATGEPYSRTFSEAKELIQGWMKETSTDYIGLLESRLYDEDYERFFNNVLFAQSQFFDAIISGENKSAIFQLANSRYGGTEILVIQDIQCDIGITFTVHVIGDTIDSKVAKWQLALAGFEETKAYRFEYHLSEKVVQN